MTRGKCTSKRFAFLLTIGLTGCANPLEIDANSFGGEPTFSGYLGVTAISLVNSTSRTGEKSLSITLAAAPTASTAWVNLYCAKDGGSPTLIAGQLDPTVTQYTYEGAIPGSTYTCNANAVSLLTNTEHLNANSVSVTMPSSLLCDETSANLSGGSGTNCTMMNVGGAYRNVILVKALGQTTSYSGYSVVNSDGTLAASTQLTAPSVTLKWAPFQTPTDHYPLLTFNSNTRFKVLRTKYNSSGNSFNVDSNDSCSNHTQYTSDTGTCVVSAGNLGDSTYPTAFVDNAVAAPTDATGPVTYAYAITILHPTNAANTTFAAEHLPTPALQPNETDTNYNPFFIKVQIPPDNMVLVHRDSVNYELCTIMNKSIQSLNHNQCLYNGLGKYPRSASSTYTSYLYSPPYVGDSSYTFDFGPNIFIDATEMGCAWSVNCYANNGNYAPACVGTTAPTTLMGTNSGFGSTTYATYYNLNSRTCSTWNGSSWQTADSIFSASPPTNWAYALASNSAQNTNSNSDWKKPPLVNVKRSSAAQICQNFTSTPGYSGQSKRLLSRREFNASAPFPWLTLQGEPGALTLGQRQQLISSNSTALNTNGNGAGCNTNSWTSGLITSISANPTPFYQPWNANSSSGVADFIMPTNTTGTSILGVNRTDLLVIGSNSTQNCLSRFGAQDLFGNAAEWVADEITKPTAGVNYAQAAASSLAQATQDLLPSTASYESGLLIPFTFGQATGNASIYGPWVSFSSSIDSLYDDQNASFLNANTGRAIPDLALDQNAGNWLWNAVLGLPFNNGENVNFNEDGISEFALFLSRTQYLPSGSATLSKNIFSNNNWWTSNTSSTFALAMGGSAFNVGAWVPASAGGSVAGYSTNPIKYVSTDGVNASGVSTYQPVLSGDYSTLYLDSQAESWDIGFRCAMDAESP